jgi:hypothetical protein
MASPIVLMDICESTASYQSKLPHRFRAGNPGRPKGTRNIQGVLNDAIKQAIRLRVKLHEPCACVLSLWQQVATPEEGREIAARSCTTLDQHFARRAFVDDTVLNALQKKRIPDLQHQTGDAKPSVVNVVYGLGSAASTTEATPAVIDLHA